MADAPAQSDPVRTRMRRAGKLPDGAWVLAALAGAIPIALGVPLASTSLMGLGLALSPVVLATELVVTLRWSEWYQRRVLGGAARSATACPRIADAIDGELVVVRGTVRVLEGVDRDRGPPCAAYQRRDLAGFIRGECGRFALLEESGCAIVEPSLARFLDAKAFGYRGARVLDGEVIAIAGRARWTMDSELGARGNYRGAARVLAITPAIAGSILVVDRA